jgi:hypothetical protein
MDEQEYWKKASEGVSVSDYPAAEEESVDFPPVIHVAYAVCTRDCGSAQFIVDGSSQLCEYCGRQRFRTVVRRYVLADENATGVEPQHRDM